MDAHRELAQMLRRFHLDFSEITAQYDTSHSDRDRRLHFVLDNRYVLKLCNSGAITEARLQGIRRLVARYRSIGVYCPDLYRTDGGDCSLRGTWQGEEYLCYVEEFAAYPVCGETFIPDKADFTPHLGRLAARFTGVDLWPTNSMWSLIDLAPLDKTVDEKQENADALCRTLADTGMAALAQAVSEQNARLRAVIAKDFRSLPRCVYQGDLNDGNLLYENGSFRGLIDFNMAGTEVNINCFLNETNWFPDPDDFDRMDISEIPAQMRHTQNRLLRGILASYDLNPLELRLLPYYRQIVDLFQYPDVCLMNTWLRDPARREKAAALLRALLSLPIEEGEHEL